MKKIRVVTILMAFIILLQISVFADAEIGEPAINASNIVTEYYTNNLLEPLGKAIPTVAGVTPEIKAKSAVLIEASTGEILYKSNENQTMAPASITKVMSILLIMEALESNKITTEDVVATSAHAAGMGGSQIWLEPGETMTVHELLKATIIGSANDATTALAEYVAGSEEGFVGMMNERAKQLGMENTNFKNCSGLDEKDHYSTAYDVALMSKELMKHEKVTEYSTVWMDSLRGGQTQLVNTNKLIRFYDGCTGLKTGTTSQAGHCLSASATKGEISVIAVVMGAATGNDRFEGARKLLDFAFANWTMAKITIDDSKIPDVKIIGGVQSRVEIADIILPKVLVPKGSEKKVTTEITVVEDVAAPIEYAQVLGKIVVKLGDEVLTEIPLVSSQAVEKMSYLKALGKLLTAIFTL